MSEKKPEIAEKDGQISSETIVAYIHDLNYRVNYFLSLSKTFGYPADLPFATFKSKIDTCIDEIGHSLIASKLQHITWLQDDGRSKQGQLLGVAFSLDDEESDFDLKFLVSDSVSDNTPSGSIEPHQIIQFDSPLTFSSPILQGPRKLRQIEMSRQLLPLITVQ